MTSLQCCICKNYWGLKTCEAFNPWRKIKHVPQKIFNGTIEHNKPLKNQGNSIVFEPFEEEIGEDND